MGFPALVGGHHLQDQVMLQVALGVAVQCLESTTYRHGKIQPQKLDRALIANSLAFDWVIGL